MHIVYGAIFLGATLFSLWIGLKGYWPGYAGQMAVLLVIAGGMFLRQRWTEAGIFGIALYGTVAWIAESIFVAVTDWPYPGVLSSVISLLPGIVFAGFWIIMWVLVRRYFRSKFDDPEELKSHFS